MHRPALFALTTLSLFAFSDAALAEYPDHAIRMIVPQAAGSSTDTVTRVLAGALAEELHQQVGTKALEFSFQRFVGHAFS